MSLTRTSAVKSNPCKEDASQAEAGKRHVRPRRSAEETRRHILITAEALFRERGFAAVSIADIATAMDMSPANVFKHFHSKNALVDAIFMQQIRLLEQKIHTLDDSHPPLERLRHLARALMENHRGDLNDNPYLFEMILLTVKKELACGVVYRDIMVAHVATIIREGVKTGDYHADDAVHAASTVLDALKGVLHPLMIAHEDIEELNARCEALVVLIDAALRYKLAK